MMQTHAATPTQYGPGGKVPLTEYSLQHMVIPGKIFGLPFQEVTQYDRSSFFRPDEITDAGRMLAAHTSSSRIT